MEKTSSFLKICFARDEIITGSYEALPNDSLFFFAERNVSAINLISTPNLLEIIITIITVP
jgi:hypothetical protein